VREANSPSVDFLLDYEPLLLLEAGEAYAIPLPTLPQ
jgi:hypothetical protein